ncbi:MAG: efflux RND transporter periplasmic adaptor subunit [Alphaproteobacteria bacterium]|nr:efflux RND transporter periplasmic adaptor subunit [Alphaproteobacteria bacterium]
MAVIRTGVGCLLTLLMTLLVLSTVPALAEFVVERQSVADLKIVFATVESTDITTARARIGGTLRDLDVDEGDLVTRGQRIATVEDEKLPQELAALDARIGALMARVDLAALDLERISALRDRNTVSQARLDEAEATFDAQAGELAAVEAEREVVRQRLKEGDILVPAAGRVLAVQAIDGTVVMPGEPIATLAVETYVLRLQLPERHARFIDVGDEVLVGRGGLKTADGTGGETQQRVGTVRKVYPQMAEGRVVADVEVEGLGDFFVGERVPVYVATGERETIIVPGDYVYRRHGLAYVRLEDGSEVVVQPGPETGAGIEILSGLRPGDVLGQP